MHCTTDPSVQARRNDSRRAEGRLSAEVVATKVRSGSCFQHLLTRKETLAGRHSHPAHGERAPWACVPRALRHDQWSCPTSAGWHFVRGLSARRANVVQAVNTPETSHRESRRHRALGDATRRSLLEALDRTTEPLDARTLAKLVGLHVNTVRWHLDILVEAGIVAREATEAAGRGRPPYGYRLSTGTLIDGPEGVSFLTQVLADVIARTDPEVGSTVEQAGRVRGRALVRPRLGAKGADTEEAVGVVVQLLERLGFEPRVQRVRRGRRIAMRPCPFGELAAEHPSVVCRAHLGLMRGVLDTLRSPIEATALEPFVKPNLCLVHLELPPDASAGKPRGGDRSLASSITSGDG